MRSWRRGTREMDLILGPFFDAEGAELDAATLDLYEDFLNENDQDLYQWISGKASHPSMFSELLNRIRRWIETGSKR